QVQARLAADRREERVRLLRRDDPLEDLDRHRLDVRAIGELGIGHDGRRVRVDEDHAVALLPEGLARLRSGGVELARLADDHPSGADEEDRADVGAAGHSSALPLATRDSDSTGCRTTNAPIRRSPRSRTTRSTLSASVPRAVAGKRARRTPDPS